MKILRFAFLCVLAAGTGSAQEGTVSGWTLQNPQPTGSTLRAVAALHHRRSSPDRHRADTMVAVGDLGTIVRTTDGGATWKRIASGTTAGLLAVSFPDIDTGFAVGSQGTILRTLDGGATWTLLASPTTAT